jgi:ABC-type Fe3+ transport system substrate-binding protein
MKPRFLRRGAVLLWVLFTLIAKSNAHGASLSDAVIKAKKDAEAKGYIFVSTRDEIIAKAKKEGRLRALSGLSSEAMKLFAEAFKKKYPFIDTHVEEIEGSDAYQRFLLELKSGSAKTWDSTYIPIHMYDDYLAHQMKVDILGMASAGILNIPLKMVDPINRNTVSSNNLMHVVAYNKKLISDDKVPQNWEDFLKPEFRGRKFLVDIRPSDLAALVPAWGLEKTLEFARKLAAQQPVWVRGATRSITPVIAGEFALSSGPSFSSVKRAQEKDASGALGYKIVEPVPIRFVSRVDGVLSTASHPHTALLWLEFHVSSEGQKILDDHGPFQASIFTPGSAIEKETKGKKLSAVDWSYFIKVEEYQSKIVEAYGFPKAN